MLKKINSNAEIANNISQTKTEVIRFNNPKRYIVNLVKKDMMLLTKIWRQVKGYSSNGQRSHSNNKNNKKVKTLNFYRLQQFYKLFGKKRRDIFPTLIVAEYTNRLWYNNWVHEWAQGYVFFTLIASKNKRVTKFDPNLLSKNVVTGFKTNKKKKKHNTAKRKIVMVGTIGLPPFFTRYLYFKNVKPELPFTISIHDESRKKMAKKKKNGKKKK